MKAVRATPRTKPAMKPDQRTCCQVDRLFINQLRKCLHPTTRFPGTGFGRRGFCVHGESKIRSTLHAGRGENHGQRRRQSGKPLSALPPCVRAGRGLRGLCGGPPEPGPHGSGFSAMHGDAVWHTACNRRRSHPGSFCFPKSI